MPSNIVRIVFFLTSYITGLRHGSISALCHQAQSYAIDVLVHLGKAVKPHRQCPALNANGLIPIVSLTVLHLNEMGLRSVGMRHY